MTEFSFGKNCITVDVERTRNYYLTHDELADKCSCAYCRNFRSVSGLLPKEVGEFLAPLGLALERPAEIMEWCRELDGRHWYTVQYHLAGELVERGEEPMEIAPEVTVGFTKDSGPFLKDFPESFFQLFLDVRLPWALEEPDD